MATEGGATVFEVHGAENCVFAVATFDIKKGDLKALLVSVVNFEIFAVLFKFCGVGKEVELLKDFFVDIFAIVRILVNDTVRRDGDSASEKVGVDGAVKNIKGGFDDF